MTELPSARGDLFGLGDRSFVLLVLLVLLVVVAEFMPNGDMLLELNSSLDFDLLDTVLDDPLSITAPRFSKEFFSF